MNNFKKITIIFLSLLAGIILGLLFIFYSDRSVLNKSQQSNQIIGFLPYWLLNKANPDYSQNITTLTYFGLRIDGNGNLLKLSNPQEEEPGWHALETGKLNTFFDNAKAKKIKLSLLISDGDNIAINMLLGKPAEKAKNLVKNIAPIMKQYGFNDLNLDIEYTQEASGEARMNFTKFVREVKKQLNNNKLGTLTVEISTTDLIKNQLINVSEVSNIADNLVLMAYDYHSTSSFVTGPIAPLSGAGIISEYDVNSAVKKLFQITSPKNIILGVPLYGYEWETIGNVPRSAIVPNTGLTASNKRAEELLAACATCSANIDHDAQESYIIYRDQETGTYHQIFFPDKNSLSQKISYVTNNNLGGIALWALGYEGSTILNPLIKYKQRISLLN